MIQSLLASIFYRDENESLLCTKQYMEALTGDSWLLIITDKGIIGVKSDGTDANIVRSTC